MSYSFDNINYTLDDILKKISTEFYKNSISNDTINLIKSFTTLFVSLSNNKQGTNVDSINYITQMTIYCLLFNGINLNLGTYKESLLKDDFIDKLRNIDKNNFLNEKLLYLNPAFNLISKDGILCPVLKIITDVLENINDTIATEIKIAEDETKTLTLEEIINSFFKIKISGDYSDNRKESYKKLMEKLKDNIQKNDSIFIISSKKNDYPYVNDQNGAMYIFTSKENAIKYTLALYNDLLEVKKLDLNDRAALLSKYFYKDNITGLNILYGDKGIFVPANELIKEPSIRKSGHDYLDDIIKAVYKYEPAQVITPIISYKLGGSDPLEQISVYDTKNYLHFITYGFSNLGFAQKNSNGKMPEYSGFGFELSLKIKKNQVNDVNWVCSLLQTYARYVFETKTYFIANQFIGVDPNSKDGINPEKDSTITAFVTDLDNKFGVYNTPNGKVEFIQLIGITQEEFARVYSKTVPVEDLIGLVKKHNSDGVTDLYRKSIY